MGDNETGLENISQIAQYHHITTSVMKQQTRFIIILLLISIQSGSLFSQDSEYTIIRISRVNYGYFHHSSGTIGKQLEIDLNNHKIYYRKHANRKFKEIKTDLTGSLFLDSVKMERIKQISKSITKDSELCRYQNEYGYFRIELLKFCREDQIYGESFLINQPYECQNETDQTLVREYYQLITQLFRDV